MKTTVKHIGSGGPDREWEGPIENWEAHVHEIKHWCDGGDVEMRDEEWAYLDLENPRFDHYTEYRIKQREPKPGEVWTLRCYAYLIHEFSGDFYQSLSGREYCKSDNQVLEYAAPSVESYYAREFLQRRNDGPLTCTVLQKAAQLDH